MGCITHVQIRAEVIFRQLVWEGIFCSWFLPFLLFAKQNKHNMQFREIPQYSTEFPTHVSNSGELKATICPHMGYPCK